MLAMLRAIAPQGASCAGGAIDMVDSVLFPEEIAAVAGAVPARRQEYLAGRHYARAAMAALGRPAAAIPAALSREPLWPPGLTGSISHSGNRCAAVVARSAELGGIGLDIESDGALCGDMAALVCTPAELARLAPSEMDLPKLHFVVKEAAYKLYFPLTGHFVDFHQATVRLDLTACRFSATFDASCPALMGQRTVHGRYGRENGWFGAICWLGA